MTTYDDNLLAARFAALIPEPLAGSWDEVLDKAGAGGAPNGRRWPERSRMLQGRRRRLLVVLAAVALIAVVTASAFAVRASYRLAANEHIEHGWFPSIGKRGSFTVELLFGSSGTRSWRLRPKTTFDPQLNSVTGQYAQITGGGGRFPAGGHQAAWYARLFGTVSRPGAAKQRVLITLKGKPNGVFVLTPLEPGVLKRDSGTQRSFETG